MGHRTSVGLARRKRQLGAESQYRETNLEGVVLAVEGSVRQDERRLSGHRGNAHEGIKSTIQPGLAAAEKSLTATSAL